MSKHSALGIALGVVVFLVTCVLGALYTFSQPTLYETEARVWVQPKLAEMVPSSFQTSLYAPLTAFFNSPITTAGEVLKSDVVLQDALDIVKQEFPPDNCPTMGDLRAGLNVMAVNNADILTLKFRYKDPKGCAAALQALLDAFKKENSTQSAQSAMQSRLFLEQQLKQAQQQSLKAREALKKFQDENDAVDLNAQVSDKLREMADLEITVQKAKTSLSEINSKVEFLQSQLKITPEQVMDAQKLAIDGEIKLLRDSIASAEVKLAELGSRLRPEHPRIAQLKATLEETKRTLRDRIATLLGVSTLKETDQVYSQDSVQQKLLADLVNARAEQIGQQSAISSLEASLVASRAHMAGIPEEQLKLTELKRASDVATQTLTDTERNLHSTRLLESVASKASNIQILDRPAIPTVPIQPRTSYGLMASAVMGLFLAAGAFLGVYFMDPSVQRVGQILGLLPLQLVGWINKVDPDAPNQEVLPGMQQLRVNLRNWLGNGDRLIITSGDPEDGKTVLAAGLGVSLSQSGVSVLILDANIYHPSLHEVFGLPDSPGLSDYLATGDQSLLPRIVHTVKDNLKVVSGGSTQPHLGSLETPLFKNLLAYLQSQCKLLIIDTPAASQSADALTFLNSSVHLLVAVRLGHTAADSLKLLNAQLRRQEKAAAGLVLFDAPHRSLVSALTNQDIEEEVLSAAPPPAAEPTSHW